jgi:hypothetical protein
MLVLFIYITRLTSNEIFSPSNKRPREVGWAKDLSAFLYSQVAEVRSYLLSGFFRKYESRFISLLSLPLILSCLWKEPDNKWLRASGTWEYRSADKSLARPGRKQVTATERFWCSYILFIIIIGGMLVLFIYITRLKSNEIFSPPNKIHREAGWAKDLSAPQYTPRNMWSNSGEIKYCCTVSLGQNKV